MSPSHADDDVHRPLLPNVVSGVTSSAMKAWDGFINFLDRDNVLEVAVGLILASAFTSVVSSFVSDILTPILSLLPFINKNLDEKFAVLRAGHKGNRIYNTIAQAQEDGAVILSWGVFVGRVCNFVGFGFALYLIAQFYSWASHDNIVKRTVRCKYCRKYIRYGLYYMDNVTDPKARKRKDASIVLAGKTEERSLFHNRTNEPDAKLHLFRALVSDVRSS